MASEQNVTKKQHYLPKAYLQFFAHQERNKKKIYAYFTSEKTVRYVPIDDICQKAYLYEQAIVFPEDPDTYMYAPNEIENSFIEAEGKYASLVKRLIDETNNGNVVTLNNEARRDLAQFMSSILYRSPVMVHIMNCFLRDEYSKHPNMFNDIKSQDPDIPESFFIAAYAHELMSRLLNLFTRATCGITEQDQLVLFKTVSSVFVTSDHPVKNIYGENNGEEYNLIGMPITPHLFLAFVSVDTVLPPIITLDDEQVTRINERQLIGRPRYILSDQEKLTEHIDVTKEIMLPEDCRLDTESLYDESDIAYYKKIMKSYRD